MKTSTTILAASVIGLVGLGGYWLGARSHATGVDDASVAVAPAAGAKPRKLLYYRNPMGLPDTSATPKKDPMGMDYVPVYEGEDDPDEAAAATLVRISTEKIQKLGVRVEAARMNVLGKTIRAAGRVEPDERRVFAIAPRYEGYVERLHVNVTGQPVAKGQALFEVYSPDLVAAQREYTIAMQGARAMDEAAGDARLGMARLAESSLARLRNWDLSADQLAALAKSGQAQRSVTFRSPVSGIVTEKKAVQGMRFMPGDMLYQVTDLSAVWVVADVPEQDIGLVETGGQAQVRIAAYPDEPLRGRVTYVYPTMNAQTRTVPIRVELPNPGGRLKPAMFAQVELTVGGSAPVLTVPDSAVIDSGTRRIVLVQAAQGRFEPREVTLGGRGRDLVEVVRGVREGESVVVAANFLIDAESNLKAAIGNLGGHAGHGDAAAAAPSAPTPTPAAIGHKATGTVEDVDRRALTVSVHHGPVATLDWPAMTMEFRAANASLLAGIEPGQAVNLEFVERQPGEFVMTSITAAGPSASPSATPAPARPAHDGH